jgi:hypothetical protein
MSMSSLETTDSVSDGPGVVPALRTGAKRFKMDPDAFQTTGCAGLAGAYFNADPF